jgi:DNA-binding NtrC family response regulator
MERRGEPQGHDVWSADTRGLPVHEVVCPACGERIRLRRDQEGSTIQCPACHAEVAADAVHAAPPLLSDPLVGTILGGCRIIGRIGMGGMGVVYRAEQLRLNRPVAVKVMRSTVVGEDPVCAARFMEEARIAARLEHPNAVQVYDVGQQDGRHYIIMQLVAGESVRALLRRKGKLSPQETLEILCQAARGLAAAHKRGMIHRDIKPSNILVDARGVARLSDFGLAKLVTGGPGLTSDGQVLGTPEYMSPEQCRGEEPDARSDIYALGVTAFEMLTGRRPFSGDTPLSVIHKQQHEPIPRTLARDPEVPRAVVSLVERMMAKGPGQRYQSAAELIDAVEGLLAAGASPRKAALYFDDRERFAVAEAALAVICGHAGGKLDEESAWEAFIRWRGQGEGEYLRRIREGRKYVFYAVLQDLYEFANETCGEDVTFEIGRQLADTLLDLHMPDVLQTTLFRKGSVLEQLQWLIGQFFAGATGEVYHLAVEPQPDGRRVRVSATYRLAAQMVDYLERSRHNPERAFANSYNVMRGSLLTLLGRVVRGFEPEQFASELHELKGVFTLRLAEGNRFNYEGFVDILLGYVERLKQRREPGQPDPIVAEAPLSAVMQETLRRMCRAAASDEIVLLRGESGVGKSHFARAIHDASPRREGPYVEVGLTSDVGSDNLIQSNLFGHVRGAFTGAESEKQGLFSLADGGTVFLDEVGDASLDVQAKLLRVLESKRFKMLGGTADISADVRIIAATNKDLAAMVRNGTFREDLYFRLNVIEILIPPLRERREDIPALVGRLFEKVCGEAGRPGKTLSDGARQALCSYHWPGNVRELENALRRAVAMSEGEEVSPDDFSATVVGRAARPGAGSMEDVIDPSALRRALAAGPPAPETAAFDWPGHVDYARRAYMRALIRHYRGDLRTIARHWNRSSENTLLKTIREFGLADELQSARRSS